MPKRFRDQGPGGVHEDDGLDRLIGDTDLGTLKSFLHQLELALALRHEDPSCKAYGIVGSKMNGRIKQTVLVQRAELLI